MPGMRGKQVSPTNKQMWPYLLLAAGPFLLAAGFVYDLLFAGIPYQDPTPEMTAGYEDHSANANFIYSCGALIFVAGLMAFLLRYLVDRK